MINLNEMQKKLLNKIAEKNINGLSSLVYSTDLTFYENMNQYLEDVNILKENGLIIPIQLYSKGEKYNIKINETEYNKYLEYLSSMNHLLFVILCKIDDILENNETCISSSIIIDGFDDKLINETINEIVNRGYVNASIPIRYTTSRTTMYIISNITFRGRQILQNEDLLFLDSNSQEIYIDNSINNSNNISYQGNNGNIVQTNNSKNQNINQEQFKEKKDNWLIRFIKWIRDFWLQLFIGIITGIISTLIVEWIFGVFTK